MTVTARNLRVLRLIDWTTAKRGYPPTVDEVRRMLGLASRSTVHGHVKRLESAGLLEHEPGSVRTLRVTEAGRERLAA